MRKYGSAFFTSVLAIGLLTGCDNGKNPVEESGPTLVEVQEQVFDVSCTGCHAGNDAPEGLILTAGSAYSNLVNVPSPQVPSLERVDPGHPEDSYLLIKVRGSDRMAPGTSQMPIRQDLSEAQITLLEEWIANGAEQ